jgi:RHS repeat-associated protein
LRSGQGTDTYVDDTWYDAAGRITLRELGNSYTLGQSYVYYPWTQQGGRLHSLQSGLPADQDSLQSLSYVYDEVGNVQSITDTNAGGTQTQTFTYDDLDRLSSAVASGGTGGTYNLQNYDYDTQGRLEINGTVTNYYENTAHIHAVSSTSSGNTYSYDQNGNQTSRRVDGKTYTLIYDAENRLVQIKRGSNIQATYTYDGEGNRVKTVVGSTTTTYIGNYLEWTGSTTTMKKYYYAGGQRVAMRQGSSTLYFLLTDHLGSTAVTATSGGGLYGELRYYPWGGTRYDSGTTPTSYRYTGQREAEVGLYYYGARYYDPSLGRFASPDTMIPQQQGSQAWDRYAGMNNNPLRYTDPSGHSVACGIGKEDCGGEAKFHMVRMGSIEIPVTDMREELEPGDPELGIPTIGVDWALRATTTVIYHYDLFTPDVDPVNYATVWLSYMNNDNGSISLIAIIINNQTDQNIYFRRLEVEARGLGNFPPKPPSSIHRFDPLSPGSHSGYLATVRPGESNTTYFYDCQPPTPIISYLTYPDSVIVKVTAYYKYYSVIIQDNWYTSISYPNP